MRLLTRRSTQFLMLLILALLVAHPAASASTNAHSAQATTSDSVVKTTTTSASTDDLGMAMTWTVLGQQNGYVHVGSDGFTNAYSGDTSVNQLLPVLCLLVDNRPAPTGITFDFYNGWGRGAVQLTSPVRGATLTSKQQADQLCLSVFGTGWHMAEFHEGRYGTNFSASSAWSFWGAGQMPAGTRFWVSINDQPANPWDSAGNVNLACSAVASAYTTYPGYSAARVNDCVPDTRLGGAYSWTNAGSSASNGTLPQWVQLDFGAVKTFSKVVVYTTQGYPIKDYDIQIWNSTSWVSVASIRGNTQTRIETIFAPQSTYLIRILGIWGPNNQPGYVRVNEFEVY